MCIGESAATRESLLVDPWPRMSRVVGLWDANKRFLKSYSVRPAQPKEEACAREFVRVSDHSMRETVAAMHES